MNKESNRIEMGGRGMGEISDEDIRRRALEIARSDGRESVREGDCAAAEAELRGQRPGAPEVDEVTGDLVEWDEMPDASGHQVSPSRSEDEDNIASELIEEGLEEADHEQRVAASKLDQQSF